MIGKLLFYFVELNFKQLIWAQEQRE